MARNKRQHYVPAFYLYHFTNERQRNEAKDRPRRETEIYHYDISRDQIIERPIHKVAIESHLYSYRKRDGSYEHSLDEEIQNIENRASGALIRLQEIRDFAVNTSHGEVKIDNWVIDAIMDLLFWQMKRHPDILSSLENKSEQYLKEQGIPTQGAKPMALYALKEIGIGGEYDILTELKKKNKYIICTTRKDAHFVTTDKPFVRFNRSGPDGIVVDGTEMYYPLSSNMLLFMHGNGTKKLFIKENDRIELRKLNIYIAESAQYYIFGKSKEYIERIRKALANQSLQATTRARLP